jgi:hypothetical protein
MYQEFAEGRRVLLATALTWSTHASCASRVGSIGPVACGAHRDEGIRDPVDVLLDRHDHVAQHRRASRAGDDEHVREVGDGEAEDAVSRLEHTRREPQSAQAVQHVQAGEAGADDDRAESLVAVLPVLRDNVRHRLSSIALDSFRHSPRGAARMPRSATSPSSRRAPGASRSAR